MKNARLWSQLGAGFNVGTIAGPVALVLLATLMLYLGGVLGGVLGTIISAVGGVSAFVGLVGGGAIAKALALYLNYEAFDVYAWPGHNSEQTAFALAYLIGQLPRKTRFTASLQAMGATIFGKKIGGFSQKIVVVDRQWSIVGSMNMLSHGPTSARRIRDIMFTMDGARFADRLLRQELADELRQIRQCPTCSRTLTECGLVGSGADRGWSWICTADRTHRLKFPGAGAPTTSAVTIGAVPEGS